MFGALILAEWVVCVLGWDASVLFARMRVYLGTLDQLLSALSLETISQ